MVSAVEGLSPRSRARLAGVFEVFEGVTGVIGQNIVPGMVLVGRDATATANNILANENLYRLGIVSALVAVILHLAWGLLLNDLLRVVNATVARFSVFVLLVGAAMQAVAGMLLLVPLLFLRGGDSLAAFSQDQLNALALVFLKLNAQANDIFLAFFGVWLVLIGYLIFRSTFLPRLIGVGLMLEGLGWAAFVSPPLGAALFTVTALFGIVGELPLGLWLLVRGVDPDRWRAQAARSGDVRVGDPG